MGGNSLEKSQRDGTGSGVDPMATINISGVETPGSVITILVI
jgi:hypothetical protein